MPRINPVGQKTLKFLYRNWRGEIAVRYIEPESIYWGKSEYHPEPQWLLYGMDCDKLEYREFAVADILSIGDHCDSTNLAQTDQSDEIDKLKKQMRNLINVTKAFIYLYSPLQLDSSTENQWWSVHDQIQKIEASERLTKEDHKEDD